MSMCKCRAGLFILAASVYLQGTIVVPDIIVGIFGYMQASFQLQILRHFLGIFRSYVGILIVLLDIIVGIFSIVEFLTFLFVGIFG